MRSSVGGNVERWVIGNVLLAVGLAWLIVNDLLCRVDPLGWGSNGPNGANIGGGLLLLMAFLLMLVGLGLSIASMASGAWRAWRRAPWLGPGLVNGLLVLGVALCWVTPHAPSGFAGRLGVTVDGSGAPVVLVWLCRGSIDEITIVGPNTGGANQRRARLHAEEPVSVSLSLDLLHPDARWRVEQQFALPVEADSPDGLSLVSAVGARWYVPQVNFTPAQLTRLTPETVQITEFTMEGTGGLVERTVSREEFERSSCLA